MTSYIIEYRTAESSFWKSTSGTSIDGPPFTVTDLKEDLEYVFRVAAENVAGVGEFSPESKPVLISIGEPPKFTRRLADKTATEEEDITLVCEVTGQPTPVAYWLKESTRLEPDERIEVVSDGAVQQLIIRGATIDDGGTYRHV